jgi:hypothetical protein
MSRNRLGVGLVLSGWQKLAKVELDDGDEDEKSKITGHGWAAIDLLRLDEIRGGYPFC